MLEYIPLYDRIAPKFGKMSNVWRLLRISATEPESFIKLQNDILCHLYDNKDAHIPFGQGLAEHQIATVVNCHGFTNQALFRLFEKKYVRLCGNIAGHNFEITPEGQIYLRNIKLRDY